MKSKLLSFLAVVALGFFAANVIAGQYQIRVPSGNKSITYTYDLNYSAYSTCDLVTSTQDRTVQCERNDGLPSDSSLCEAPVDLTQSCTPAYTYTFNNGSWGTCDLVTATQSRTVQCERDHDSLVVANSFCGAPVTSQACAPNYTYTAAYSAWGTCDAGTSTQTRTASCTRDHDSLSVANSFCSPLDPVSQACTPYTYAWVTGNYGACTGSAIACPVGSSWIVIGFQGSCWTTVGWGQTSVNVGPKVVVAGSGTKIRSVTCKRSPDNVTVTPGTTYCTGAKPPSSASCP